MALAIKEAQDLISDLGLTGEELATMEKILTDEKRQNVIKSRMHGKGEADRLMAEARAEGEKYKALEADANAKIDGWMKWFDEKEKENGQLKTEAQQAREKEQGLRNYLTSQGIDPEMAVPAIQNQPNNQPNGNSAFDWKKVMDEPEFKKAFIPREEGAQQLNAVLQLGDIQHKLNLRHRKLFGTDIEDFATLREQAMAAKKDLPTYADEAFGFTKKEAENAEKALEERAEKMAQERLQAMISKQGIPGANAAITPDDTPIFNDDFANKGTLSEFDADRKAVERAMQFQLANPTHASDMGDTSI